MPGKFRPNKRLKRRLGEHRSLAEPAAGECAARESAEILLNNRYVRAMNFMELTVGRRSHVSPDGVKHQLAAIR